MTKSDVYLIPPSHTDTFMSWYLSYRKELRLVAHFLSLAVLILPFSLSKGLDNSEVMDTWLHHPPSTHATAPKILNEEKLNSLHTSLSSALCFPPISGADDSFLTSTPLFPIPGDLTSQGQQHVAKGWATVIHKEDPLHVE